jgi:hypothetical protein
MPHRMTGRARFLLLSALSLVGLIAAGCGNKTTHQTEGETEGIYVQAGPLTYQVQISRLLNPADIEDQAYLKGVPAGERELPANEAWFAVFMRVQNEGEKPQVPTRQYKIVDTQENEFKPLALPADNVFAYNPPRELPPEQVYPDPDSSAGAGPIQGSLLLFRVKIDSLANRPLELNIDSPEPPPLRETATIKLDV